MFSHHGSLILSFCKLYIVILFYIEGFDKQYVLIFPNTNDKVQPQILVLDIQLLFTCEFQHL